LGKKNFGGGEGKRKCPARQCKVCAAHKLSGTRYICKFYVVPLYKGSCFEKYHSVTYYQTIFCYTIQLMHYSHFKTQSLQHLKSIKC